MVSQLFVVFNVFALLLFELTLGSDITVTHNLPAQVENSAEFSVDLVFNKGKLDEYGKFTMELPEGFTAEMVDVRDGSFTFQNQKILITWLSLPADEEFVVALKIKTGPNMNQAFDITGKFSALDGNDKVNYNIPAHQIIVGTLPGEENANDPIVVNAGCTRSVTQTSANEYEVSLTVEKEGLSQFAKVEEYLPEGAKASVVENKNAVFSTVDEKAKFVWMKLPDDNIFTVSYKVTVEGEDPDFENMEGKFSYLQEEETKKQPITTTEVTTLDEATPSDPVVQQPDPADPADPANAGAMTREEILAQKKAAEEEAQRKKEEELARLRELDQQQGGNSTEQQVEDPAQAQAAADEAKRKAEEEAQRLADEEAKRVADAEAEARRQAEEAERIAQEEKAKAEAEAARLAQAEADRRKAEEERKKAAEQAALAQQNNGQNGGNGVTNVPDPQTGVVYRVQISAGKNMVDKAYFEKRHSFSGPFYIENHEGWIKYTTGGFGVYKGARDQREDYKAAGHNFPGPFVTAYDDGTRITVQEALMITNQKWFQ
ncbi:MAG: hypothetical protein ACFB10_24620 [Salibacteraceae bacterium]